VLRYTLRATVLAVLALLSAPSGVRGQVAPTGTIPERLTVFLDCRTSGCDRNFLITELPWVLWTQDRLDALITGLETGAGGTEITIALLGQRRFAGRGDTLVTSIPPNSTDDAERREVTRLLKLALVPYALRTGVASQLELGLSERQEDAGPPRGISDPWNFWVYRLSGSGGANAESRESEFEFDGSLSASRITERTKIVLDLDYEYQGASFTLSDSTKESFVLREYDFDQRFVRSITDHWSVGGGSSVGMTEFSNQQVYAAADVGAEYNLYPWREATRRQLVAIVTVGGRYYDYEERTIYGLTAEIRPSTSFIVAGETRQAWGSADASLEHSRFLHRTDSYSLRFDGSANIRITRGLSLRIGAFGQKVNDQLYLPRGDATDEEVLTRQRALATAYRYGANIGLSFTFGSIYNTIVNPRFDRVN
jgi:hypothetical protein